MVPVADLEGAEPAPPWATDATPSLTDNMVLRIFKTIAINAMAF